MDSMDLQVLQALHDWQRQTQPVWLVTVSQTFGSSPRPAGAMLALRGDGLSVGSVSGGCIEDDLMDKARAGELNQHQPQMLSYGVSRDEAQRFGLPCGGVMQLIIEPVPAAASWPGDVLTSVRHHRLLARCLDMQTGQVRLQDARLSDEFSFNLQQMKVIHGPRWRLLIIGTGQTSEYLAQMAQALDYQVLVCDPRPGMLQTWSVANCQLLNSMPDDAVVELQVDARTAIIALTHDPKIDDMALLEALKSPAFYVGALGSKKNNANRRERLAMFDLSAAEIARLHGPVGLAIGSKTPPEIAVSIVAHLVQVRSQLAVSQGAPRIDAVCQ
ncbi:MAG: XdhC family protein [Methylophaga sp.]|nr:XdhC family protein [Methylophaga sp.]